MRRRHPAKFQVRRVTLALAALLGLSTTAYAADLNRGPVIAEPYEYRPDLSWNGFYAGATYGYATGWTDVTSAGSAFDIDTTGGNGTLFAGYNWQFAHLVAGIETDIGWGSLGGSENGVSNDLNVMGSVRGRLGYLLSPAFLVYGTAGFAWAEFDISALGDTASETFTGYQVGGGTELKFAQSWALRLEYVYTDLDPETVSLNAIPHTVEPDFHTVRAGLTFKF